MVEPEDEHVASSFVAVIVARNIPEYTHCVALEEGPYHTMELLPKWFGNPGMVVAVALLLAFGDMDVVVDDDDVTIHELDSPFAVVVLADGTHLENASITGTLPFLDANDSNVTAIDAFHDPFHAPFVAVTIDESSHHLSIDIIPGTKIVSSSPHVAWQRDSVSLSYFLPLACYVLVRWKRVCSVELVDVDREHVVHVLWETISTHVHSANVASCDDPMEWPF